MDIIKCVVRGQRLSVNVPVMADLTVNYFNVMANFDSTWERYPLRYVHIHSVEDSSVGSDWFLDEENKVANTEGINLTAGEWEIWYHGAILDDNDEIVSRITTEKKVFKILPTGNAGGIMPEIPESNVEQITALAQEAVDIAQGVRDDADAGDFNGATFYPTVNNDGDISWTNDKNLPNPATRNIKGPKGDTGTGIPSGGTEGQAVVMGANNETTWADVAPKSHASTGTSFGKGSASNYGHVKLSDATDSTSSTSGGTAATPKAVKDVMDAIPPASNTPPIVDGTANAGNENAWARGNHVHPHDTTSDILFLNLGTINSLPFTYYDSNIRSDMYVVQYYIANVKAMTSGWTVTTANGSLTIAGSIYYVAPYDNGGTSVGASGGTAVRLWLSK